MAVLTERLLLRQQEEQVLIRIHGLLREVLQRLLQDWLLEHTQLLLLMLICVRLQERLL
ncbi:hypothetical protein D9M72_406030 [compost metagenome]